MIFSEIRDIAAEVPLTIEDGMPQACVVNLDVITTIPKDSLRSRHAILTHIKLKEIEEATHFAMGLDQ